MASVVVDGLRVPIPVAGRPALDFLNTRAGWPVQTNEYLHTYPHVAVWARERGLAAWRVRATTDPVLVPFVELVRDVGRLLVDPAARHVRACPMPDCGWVFADPSGRRRWCSMAWCGNRSKVRRHAARARLSTPA